MRLIISDLGPVKIIPYLAGVNNEYEPDDILSQVTEFSLSLPGLITSVCETVFSTLIGRGMSRLGSHWSRAS